MTPLATPWQRIADIFFPWREDADASGRRWRLGLHVLVWATLLAGLWWINRQTGVERLLRSPWPLLHTLWLPALGGTLYFICWLTHRLWLALADEEPISPWPEIDAAWNDARIALAKAQVRVSEVPLYVVLGPLSPELRGRLEATSASALLGVHAPFQVFARADAVFVVCGALSHLGMSDPTPATASPWSLSGDRDGRLAHLCHVLCRERPAAMAVQGVVLALPFAAARNDGEPRDVVMRCRKDLTTIRSVTGLDVPVYLAITGMGDLTAAAAQAGATRAWFQRFPPLPDLDPAEVVTMFREGISWLCATRIAQQLRSRFQLDISAADPGALTPMLRDNLQLYQCGSAVQTLRPGLAQLLVDGTRNEFGEPGMVVGCYLLCGDESVQSLFGDLASYRHFVTFTPSFVAEQDLARRRVRQAYALGIVGAVIGLAGIAWLFWSRL